MKRLLLVGGGHAHLQVLQALAAEPLPSAEVTLLSPQPQFLYSGMLPGWVAGHYAIGQCRVPLQPLAARARVRWLDGCAIGLDSAAKQLRLADGSTLGYDVLSLDVGATMDRDAIAGAREHGHFVRPLDGFVELWERLQAMAAERPLCLAVIGAGAAGVELAMAFAHRLGPQARVSLVSGGALLPDHGPAVQRRARRALRRAAVTLLDERCVRVEADKLVLESGMRVACDAPVLALGAAAHPWLRDSGLALDGPGFVVTDAWLRSVSHPEVFAAGDTASRSDAPRPKNGVHALRAGVALSLNLRRALAGGELQPHRPQRRALSLLACGERRAIGSWAGVALEGAWVWRWKDHIDRAFVRRHGGSA